MDLADLRWSLLVIYFIVLYFTSLFRIQCKGFADHDAFGVTNTVWFIFSAPGAIPANLSSRNGDESSP
jgi:hypothetical protein